MKACRHEWIDKAVADRDYAGDLWPGGPYPTTHFEGYCSTFVRCGYCGEIGFRIYLDEAAS